jgi:hypothetical protein
VLNYAVFFRVAAGLVAGNLTETAELWEMESASALTPFNDSISLRREMISSAIVENCLIYYNEVSERPTLDFTEILSKDWSLVSVTMHSLRSPLCSIYFALLAQLVFGLLAATYPRLLSSLCKLSSSSAILTRSCSWSLLSFWNAAFRSLALLTDSCNSLLFASRSFLVSKF